MNLNPRTRCPYTLKPLGVLATVNAEHVIHNSLGCPRSYSVQADAATNSKFGETVDANFLTGLTVASLRTKHGIESYSGPPKLKLAGTTVQGGHPVNLTFFNNRSPEIHFIKPVIRTEDGKCLKLIAGEDWKDRLASISKNLERKGKKLTPFSSESLPTTEVNVRAEINLTHLRVGLMKIGYLVAFEYLGDPFLDDPLNAEWQKGIRATEASQLEEVGIQGSFHDDEHVLDMVIPELQSHQHAVVVMHMEQMGPPMVCVRLFGSPHLSMLAKLSETQDFGMKRIQGKVVVCDSRSKSIAVSTWEDHMLRKCGPDPSINHFWAS